MTPERTRAHVMATDGKHAGGGHIAVVEKVGGAWNVTREMPRDRGPAKCKMEGRCHRAEGSSRVHQTSSLGRGREPRHRHELGRRRRRAAPSRRTCRSIRRASAAPASRPAFEGWYPNADGSFSLLIGYYNRNSKEALDIPIGPNNRIEPGEPDQGQPTYFEIGRQWGVFVIKVPKDFGKQDHHLDDRRRTARRSRFRSR